LAQRLIELLNHPEQINQMGSVAHESVKRFGIDIVADRWKSLFETLLSKGK
jgi:glycosyltransferase involved in cell wall biosynthesis